MKRTAFFRPIYLVITLLTLSFSAFPARADEVFWGQVIGGSLGGLVGNQFGHGDAQMINTGVGATLGVLAGNQIGSSLHYANNRARPYGGAYMTGDMFGRERRPYVPNYVAPPEPDIRIYYVDRPVSVTGHYLDGR